MEHGKPWTVPFSIYNGLTLLTFNRVRVCYVMHSHVSLPVDYTLDVSATGLVTWFSSFCVFTYVMLSTNPEQHVDSEHIHLRCTIFVDHHHMHVHLVFSQLHFEALDWRCSQSFESMWGRDPSHFQVQPPSIWDPFQNLLFMPNCPSAANVITVYVRFTVTDNLYHGAWVLCRSHNTSHRNVRLNSTLPVGACIYLLNEERQQQLRPQHEDEDDEIMDE